MTDRQTLHIDCILTVIEFCLFLSRLVLSCLFPYALEFCLIFELLMSEFTRREFLNDLKFWRIITWTDVYLMVFRWKCYSSHEKKKQQRFNDLIWVAQWKPRNAIVHNSNCRVLHTEWFDDMRHNFYLSTQYDKKKTGCGDSGSSSVNVVDSLDLYCLLFCRDIAHLSWHDCELPCIKNYANLFIFRFQRLCIVLILYFSNLHQRNPPNTRSFVRSFVRVHISQTSFYHSCYYG